MKNADICRQMKKAGEEDLDIFKEVQGIKEDLSDKTEPNTTTDRSVATEQKQLLL